MLIRRVLEHALNLFGDQINARQQSLLQTLVSPSLDEHSNIRRELKLIMEQHARLPTYEFGFPKNYNCPHCWLRFGTKIPLRSIPGTSETDIFKCENGDEFECSARS